MKLASRLIFLALLGGGLLYWAHLRRPRELRVDLDLTRVLPGEVSEADVIVRREGHLLMRSDRVYGPRGAPGTIPLSVHAAPGPAELEITLVRASGARQWKVAVTLSEPELVKVHVGEVPEHTPDQ